MRIWKPIITLCFLSATLIAADELPADFHREKSEQTIRADVERICQGSGTDSRMKVWVYFTDKGFSTLSAYREAVESEKSNLTPRAAARRLKAKGAENLIDYKDLPVFQPYAQQVLATGCELKNTLRWFNAITVSATPEQIRRIAELPFVVRIKKVAISSYAIDDAPKGAQAVEPPLSATTLNYGASLAQLEQINAVAAHELGFAGQDVLVCMMDTGYRLAHQAFQAAFGEGRVIDMYDFVRGDNYPDYDSTQDAPNQPDHGTLTWSALGGLASGQLYGPAYAAQFCLSKTENIDSELHVEEDNWAAGAQWADSLGADVISASLGYRFDFSYPDEDYTYSDMNGDSTIVSAAADQAVRNGITVVTAMGNDGNLGAGSLIAPADGDSVIAVGAVDEWGYLASFSAQGPTYDGRIKPEICARGIGTACADPYNMTGYRSASGTSLSTPLAGGAAALLLSVHPNWTPMMVREALMMTAANKDNPDNYFGWGILDVARAMYYHPAGDIVIDHEPLIRLPLTTPITISARISGGAGINPSGCIVYWRENGDPSFHSVAMTTGNGADFSASIPGPDTGALQYYIEAADINGITVTYPFGAPEHYFHIPSGITEFNDSFENGLYYWKSSGTNGGWSLNAERTASGNLSVTDSPKHDYRNNCNSYLTGNFRFNLGWADTVYCRVKARYLLQPSRDFVYFEVSSDGGNQWQIIGQPITGSSTVFTTLNFDLSGYLGMNDLRCRFRMTTDNSTVGDGIYLDDFVLGWHEQTGIADDGNLPQEWKLLPNYPNPFNSNTEISFVSPTDGKARIDIFDIGGRLVKTVFNGDVVPGLNRIRWGGKGDAGHDVVSGIYFYRLSSSNFSELRKMALIR